uniref:Vesicular inhibitory amino acid transporter-like protein n=1 Tax=Saccoglossus kowalevskii TaxID=10224 RepID=A0A1B1JCG0_SACKO|nr:vesicular inhibitory amino acid transporter-like protein [Saccoglossus kowalevskii]
MDKVRYYSYFFKTMFFGWNGCNGCNGDADLYENREDIELCPKESNGDVFSKESKGSLPGSLDKLNEYEKVGSSSAWQAGWNVGNCMQGLGILSLPYTVKQSGIASILTIAGVLLLGNYTSKILVDCLYEEEDIGGVGGGTRKVRVRNSYPDIAVACWNKLGSHLVNVITIVDVTAVATLYLELSGALLVDTFPVAGLSKISWICLSAFVVLPSVFFKNLTRISYLSLIAVLAIGGMLFSVVWYSFGESIKWKLNTVPPFDTENFAISFSVILFNFGTQFIMPGVEESMRERQKFGRMVNFTYLAVALVNMGYAFFAYLTFTDNTQEFITYNLPLGFIQTTVSILFIVKSLLSYPLMFFLIVTSIESMNFSFLPPCYPNNTDEKLHIWSMIFRFVLLLFTLLLAVSIPHFTLLMGVTGSLTSPWLDFIFPCIFHMQLKKGRLRFYHIFADIAIILIGLVGGGIGLVYSCKVLVRIYTQDQ